MEKNRLGRVIPFSPPDISENEISEAAETLRSGWITTGPRTKLLERRLAAYLESGRVDIDCEIPSAIEKYRDRVVCLNSATAAEELNLRILGVGPGDEVIVPAYTYTATASAVIHCGARVVFVDAASPDGDAKTRAPEMDYEKMEAAITEKTKAVIPVDLGGIPCDYDRIYWAVERKRHLFTPVKSDGTLLGDMASRIQKALGRVAVVADSAHSLGARCVVSYINTGKQRSGKENREKKEERAEKKRCGTLADFTSFSFHAVKNLTTAEGGAAAWRSMRGIEDAEIYQMYQLLSLHGQSKDALAKTKAGAWEYDIVGPWYKCNMTDVMAAIGLRQLDRYPKMLARRREIIGRYNEICDRLGLFRLNHEGESYCGSGHLYLARIPGADLEKRNEVITRMAEQGIACNVHYKPLPMMSAYRKLGWNVKDFPNAYRYFENEITLPLHTKLTDEDVGYVGDGLERSLEIRKNK